MQSISLKLVFILVAFLFNTAIAQELIKPKHLNDLRNVNEIAVSKDGNLIAYTLISSKHLDDGIGYSQSELFIYNVKTEQNRAVISGDVFISSLSWGGENDDKLFFLQNTKNTNGSQIFTYNPQEKESKFIQLTALDYGLRSYKLIDNNSLLYIKSEDLSPERLKLNKGGIDIKIYEEEARHLELYKYDIKNKESEAIIKSKTVYDYELSPDKTKIAITLSEKNLVDYYYMFRKIHIIDLKSGKIIQKLDNPGKLGAIKWSPNSKKIAFLSAYDINDAVVGSIFIWDSENKNQKFADIKSIVDGMELSAVAIEWKDNNSLFYSAEKSTDIILNEYDLKKSTHNKIIKGGEVIFKKFEYQNKQIYFAANSRLHPNELFTYELKDNKLTKLTNHNIWLEKVKLAKQETISYQARDGKRIDGVLVYPLDYDESKKYPMIVYIHGGPEAAVLDGWSSHYSTWGQFAAAKGFFVFSPNYRASSSRGVEFTMAGFGDLLGKEYDDVLDGIDYFIEKGLVDKSRIGIGGGSYGGFFAAYSATKHSDRFAASVVFVGISNQISKRNITDIPQEDYLVHWGFWTHENWEKVWNASPVKYAANSKTPTLILHGEDDTRIPVSQGLELYRSLKQHSKAPVRFVIYPGEGHGNRKNINRYDYLLRCNGLNTT